MLYNLNQYISNSVHKVFQPAIGQRVKYTAKTGTCVISTANTNLDGTGSIPTFITGASNGTYIETITIQAIGNTTRGMVRLFLTDNSTFTDLIAEVDIPAKIQSGVDKAFSATIRINFMLKSGWVMAASTEKSESFTVIASGLDTAFP